MASNTLIVNGHGTGSSVEEADLVSDFPGQIPAIQQHRDCVEDIYTQLSSQLSQHEKRMAKLLEEHQRRLIESMSSRFLASGASEFEQKAWADHPAAATSSKSQFHAVLPARPPENPPQLQDFSKEAAIVTDPQRRHQTLRTETSSQLRNLEGSQQALSSIQAQLLKVQTSSLGRVLGRFSMVGRSSQDGCVSRFVESPFFDTVSCCSIIVNAATIGAELDWQVTHPHETENPTFKILNIFFTSLFTTELLLRILAGGTHFFSCSNISYRWNIFDTILVFSSLLEELLTNAAVSVDASALRLFRTLRLIRSFRIIRVFKVFRDLRIMMIGIVNSLRSLIWALLLLFCIIYLVAVCMLQFAGEEVRIQFSKPELSSLSPRQYAQLVQFYGSLGQAIYTLFLSICGGIDWYDAAEPMTVMSTALGLLFCLYVSFAVMCVLNIVTGVFVESANRLCSQDDEMVLLEQMEIRKKWINQVKLLFENADQDSTGAITMEQFCEAMSDAAMLTMLRKIGVQVESYTSDGLFALLDFDGDGTLDIDEFCMALESVHGPARAIDVARIRKDTQVLRNEVHHVLEAVRQG